jgi:hypothetical protein
LFHLVQDAACRAGGGVDGFSQRGERAWIQIGRRAGGEDVTMRGDGADQAVERIGLVECDAEDEAVARHLSDPPGWGGR